jgi:hypothetical protein
MLQLSLQKAIPSFYQASCCKIIGNVAKDQWIPRIPRTCAYCCILFVVKSSFIRSNVVLNVMMVRKVLCKSMDNSFGTSISRKEDKSISRVSVYSSENKNDAPSKTEAVQCSQSGSGLVILRSGAICRTHCWSLMLADWALSTGYN